MKHAYRWTAPLALSVLSACGGGSHSSSSGPATVSIGGSISGLTASGLVLTDNGSDPIMVAAGATSFVFDQHVAAGDTYAVAVQSQPTGETCTVSGGSSTASTNVTSIAVACTANAPTTYTIGGSISGLTASGLVLTDNGSDPIMVAAGATSFVFDQHVAAGDTYAVAVQSQPTGETCTVSGGSSTASANVTNVAVSCTVNPPPASYTIGGTASGLAAEGLVLQDNGGDSLTVQAYAASFQFATALPSGTAYTVTVQTQPAGETCTVANDKGTATADVANVAVTCATAYAAGGANVATVVVGPGPADPDDQAFNIPYVSIKVCDTGTPQQCAVIDDVQVDTGSSGLRLLASALTNAGLTLTPMQDGSGNPISECHPFGGVDYSWGAVASATVTIGDETTASPIPVQVIDGSAAPSPSCTGIGTQQSSVDDFDANGVLGVGLFVQDCGTGCNTQANSWYYSCPSGGTCTQIALAPADQVVNPVTTFTVTGDDNGVALQLPSIPVAGQPTATGFLVFGIGTESNNGLGSATVLLPDASGYISTTISGPDVPLEGFFDSGSNYLAFDDSALAAEQCLDMNGDPDGLYCPSSSPQTVTGQNVDTGSTSVPFSIDIANLDDLSISNFALDDVGGVLSGQFDWGLPFFYGRTVFTAIQDASVGGTTYANGFYAY